MKAALSSVFKTLGDTFYPPACVHCDRVLLAGEEWLCLPCLGQLPKTRHAFQPKNPVASAFVGRVPLERAGAYLRFYKGGVVQSLMHQLKYRRQPEVGVFLGALAAEDWKDSGFFGGIDGLVPVPLHPKKRQKRGYNQAERIAAGISGVTGIPVWEQYLYRRTHSETQTLKGRFERWQNVERIFALRDSGPLRHQHLLLIDDVLTTGATLEGCLQTFLSVPDISLSVMTLAQARH